MLTSDLLRLEMEKRGYLCSKRQLLDWVNKGLLPPLSERGKGQGRGKSYFWNDASVVQQAIAIQILRRLKYPTPVLRFSIWLMGFSSDLAKARSGWLSQLERMQVQQTRKTASAEKRRGVPFSDFEDKASDLSLPIAQKLSKAFRLDIGPVAPASLEIYNFVFGDRRRFNTEGLDDLMKLMAQMIGFADPDFRERELADILEFLQSLSLHSAYSLAKHSTDEELEVARGQWLQLVGLFTAAFPAFNEDICGLTVAKFFSVQFGAECLLPFLAFIRRGKRREVSITLENVSNFVRNHDIPQSLSQALIMINMNRDFRADIVSLLNDLSILWRHRGYPFSVARI